MLEDVVRRNEWRPGIPGLREVRDFEGEVNRLSYEGWVAVLWLRVPPPSGALDLLLLAVAKTAKRYSRDHIPRWLPDAWYRAAKALVAWDQLPIPVDFGREVTLNRLIRWLKPEARALVMGVVSPSPETGGIETVGEWFTRLGEAGCLILTPSRLKGPSHAPPTFRSEAEQLLFNALKRDPLLRDPFEPNAQVLSRLKTVPCMDFLWREEKSSSRSIVISFVGPIPFAKWPPARL